jgi:F-type H+-transporting ATPase subunit alpha
VGGNAQVKAMKQVAGTLRLALAQFRELEAFAQFGSDLDAATQRQLARGERTVEILKQPQYQPMPVADQVTGIWAVTNGLLDEIEIEDIRDWETGFVDYMRQQRSEIRSAVQQTGKLEEETERQLREAVMEYNRRFNAERGRATAEAAAADA